MIEDIRGKSKSNKHQPEGTHTESSSDGGSIFGIWEDQRRIQAEEDRMAKELAATKKKAKELSKTLRKHRYGEMKEDSLGKIKKGSNKLSKHIQKSSKVIQKRTPAKKKITILVIVLALLIMAYLIFLRSKPSTNSTLGESTENSAVTQELPIEKPIFSILIPIGSTEQDLDIKRTNPPGSAASYTFIDNLDGSEVLFQVTQQEIPQNFNLEKTATDFQANNIIQIDDSRVYHGLSDKTKVQSLVFIKNGKLVLISSPQKFTDDQWAGYITGLK